MDGGPLAPVTVWRRREGAPAVDLVWPSVDADQRLFWVLHLENGGRREGAVRPADLPVAGAVAGAAAGPGAGAGVAGGAAGGARRRRHVLALPAVPDGYHRLELWPDGGAETPLATATLVATPRRAFLPPSLEGEDVSVWGPAQPLAGLRSGRQWGCGDLSDLAALLEGSAELGAGVLAAGSFTLAAERPGRPPRSRRFLDPRHLDVTAVSVFADCPAARELVDSGDFQARLAAAREPDHVAGADVSALQEEVLPLLWDHFRTHHLEAGTDAGREFGAFRAAGGRDLERFAVHQVLVQQHDGAAWPRWPRALQDPDGDAVARVASQRADAVARHQWVQWELSRQLAAVGRRSQELGLRVGLLTDLDADMDPAGVDAWLARGQSLEEAVTTGGGAALRPDRLRAAAYAPLVAALRAAMRETGAVRLRDAGRWLRPRWRRVGSGAEPAAADAETVTVELPTEEILGLLALESRRQRCLLVAELDPADALDLAAAFTSAGILVGTDLVHARTPERELPRLEDLPAASVLAVDHDHRTTLPGWWRGRDLAALPAEARVAAAVTRAADRARLLGILAASDVLPEHLPADPADPAATPEFTAEHVAAVHAVLAAAPPWLLLIRLEDVLGVIAPAAPPAPAGMSASARGPAGATGTTGGADGAGTRAAADAAGPRKLPVTIAELLADERLEHTARLLRPERGRGRMATEPTPKGPPLPAVPRATYRLQLSPEHGFDRAAELLPYLRDLGVSHLYASPFLRARPGSSHGYDIIDHNQVNPEYGGPEAFDRLTDALAAHGMGLILDHVPNHMGVGSDNAWWMDVLEHGPASRHAAFFDIDWRPRKPELHGRVILPILEDHFGRVLARGLLHLALDPEAGTLAVHYWEHRFPLDPATYPQVLALSADQQATLAAEDDVIAQEYRSLVDALAALPSRDDPDPTQMAARGRDQRVHKRRLARLLRDSPLLARLVGENVAALNGSPEHPESFTALGRLLEDQAWRLAFWRVAGDEINYRRFFDINDLAGLRMENDEVFEATHGLVLELVASGRLQGVRLDHLDGLYDPAGYCHQLRARLGEELTARHGGAPEEAADAVYVVAEKILADHERLPADWPVQGTTGYEFARLVGGLLVDGDQARALDRAYTRFVGQRVDYEELLYQSKQLIMRTSLASELNVLADQLDRISEADWRTRDFTRSKLREALREIVACFPVYRTYLAGGEPSADDVRHVEWAVARARRRSLATDQSVFDFLQDVLLGRVADGTGPALRGQVRHFARRVQQFTSPVTAKGMEDTTFYLYNRLLSLNEVGGEPEQVGVSVAAFHHHNRERQRHWPHAMLGTSTHDSKRSEDVRARISVLSEIPARWAEAAARWSVLNRRHRRKAGGALAPVRNDEYAFYQNLLGIWPEHDPAAAEREQLIARLREAMLKSVREGKRHSSWINPDAAYEEALARFVERTLDPATGEHFLRELQPLLAGVAHHGRLGGLSQTLLKLTAPGVPDVYQGTELWAHNLVDPDNRRPVDHAGCATLLAGLRAETERRGPGAVTRDLWRDPADGRAKLWLTWRTLQLRSEYPVLFAAGDYLPVEATGTRADHVVAFARVHEGEACLVIAPRLTVGLCGWPQRRLPLGGAVWDDTVLVLPDQLAGVHLVDVLTGAELDVAPGRRSLPLATALADFPAALLIGGEEAGD